MMAKRREESLAEVVPTRWRSGPREGQTQALDASPVTERPSCDNVSA